MTLIDHLRREASSISIDLLGDILHYRRHLV